jgi:hypothetical protein
MKRTSAALVMIALTAVGASAMDVMGVLSTGTASTTIDSAGFVVGALPRMSSTAGWSGDTMQVDTFLFTRMSEWPSSVTYYAHVGGMARTLSATPPVEDSWYVFAGPFPEPKPKVKLVGVGTGAEEDGNGRLRAARLTVTPSVGTGVVRVTAHGLQAEQPLLEVYDAAGNTVRVLSAPAVGDGSAVWVWRGDNRIGRLLPDGVYYFRVPTRDGAAIAKVVLAR